FATRPTAPYRRFHGVMPSWDNTARVGRRAYLAVNSSPESYRSWLETVCNRTRHDRAGDERVVFINAWNEWGEGCHLEPDRRYGLAWLEATRAALGGTSPRFSPSAVEGGWPGSSVSRVSAQTSGSKKPRYARNGPAPMFPGAMMSSPRSTRSSRTSR